MNEALLESAHLYALGILPEADQMVFEQELRTSPALQVEVHSLQGASLVLARSAPQVPPPADLRAGLVAAFKALPDQPENSGKLENVMPFPAPAAAKSHIAAPQSQTPIRLLHFIPWAAAAAMAVLFYQNNDAITSARLETAASQKEGASLKEREKHFLEAISLSENAKTRSDASLADLRTQLSKSEATLASLDKERESLRSELALLRTDSRLDKTRIAVLGSLLKDQPQAVAVSLWRQESQEGLLVVENMPALPAGRDYQLWVIDPNLKAPVSAGVFKVDAEGNVRLEFKPTRNVQSAYKFAVTMEKEGGAMVPTMDQMMVIGG